MIEAFLWQQGFANEAWQLRVIGLYSLDDEDSMWQLKLGYWWLSNLEVWVGGDFFGGTRRGSFGQFQDQVGCALLAGMLHHVVEGIDPLARFRWVGIFRHAVSLLPGKGSALGGP